jgi:uncharacterized membrane protein
MIESNREHIHLISKHSTLSQKEIHTALHTFVYPDKSNWTKFLRVFFISLGIGFATAGIIFFFAYNWADLHKFAKLGLTQGLLLMTVASAYFLKDNLLLKNVLLTAASMLVGVLFAVFGQIYQTGANAYDFFLGWTVFIGLWVVVSNFAPLWLLFITLINITLCMYADQVAFYWSENFLFTILFILNAAIMMLFAVFSKIQSSIAIPNWFLNCLVFAVGSIASIGNINSIFENIQIHNLPILFLLSVIVYSILIVYSLKHKIISYIAMMAFSIISIISALIIKVGDDLGMLLVVSLFIVISVTVVIKALLSLQNKWSNE